MDFLDFTNCNDDEENYKKAIAFSKERIEYFKAVKDKDARFKEITERIKILEEQIPERTKEIKLKTPTNSEYFKKKIEEHNKKRHPLESELEALIKERAFHLISNPFESLFGFPQVHVTWDCLIEFEFPAEYIGNLEIRETDKIFHFGSDWSISNKRERVLLSIDHRVNDYLYALSEPHSDESDRLNTDYLLSFEDFEIKDKKGRYLSVCASPLIFNSTENLTDTSARPRGFNKNAVTINSKKNRLGDIFLEVNYQGKNTLDEAFPDEIINAADYCCAEWFEWFDDYGRWKNED